MVRRLSNPGSHPMSHDISQAIGAAVQPRVAGVPRSLGVPSEFLSRAECVALFEQIVGLTRGGGETRVTIDSAWNGGTQWARSRVHVASETRTVSLAISRTIRGAWGSAGTTRLDAAGLQQAVRDAEQSVRLRPEAYETLPESVPDAGVTEPTLQPVLWDAATYGCAADTRTPVVQTLMAGADDAGLLTFGTLGIIARGSATLATTGVVRYYPTTEVLCSVTVRDPQGTASGWAGVNHYALGKLDPHVIAARALEKCQRMHAPTAVEPGRYTVILEPQAMADLFEPVLNWLGRETAEHPMGPFGGRASGRSKIGERVLDRRLMLRADPMDPDGGFLPYEASDGTPYHPVTWIDRGVLRELAYDRRYALRVLHRDRALLNPGAFRLAPADGVPTATIEEMIARTQRGILVTRFHDVRPMDMQSVLCTGYTRDGTWLIENGKLSRPLKNFRFTESPLFVLNNIDDVGVPQRVFASGRAYVAPAVRVHDFSFTGLADGV